MSTQIEFVDTRTAPEEKLRALHELYLRRDEELQPADPPVPFEQRLADWRYLFETVPVPRWVLWKGPEVVATSGMYYDLEQNLENAFGWVYVHPHHRVPATGGRSRFPCSTSPRRTNGLGSPLS